MRIEKSRDFNENFCRAEFCILSQRLNSVFLTIFYLKEEIMEFLSDVDLADK